MLLIAGEKTHRHFSSVVDVLETRLPRVKRLTLPGAEHATLLEPSDILLFAVRGFLAGNAPIL